MLPQNMATWHTDYFKLNLRNGRYRKDFLTSLSLLKEVIRRSDEKCPLGTQKEGTTLYSKMKGCQEESEEEGIAASPGLLPLVQTLLSFYFSYNFLLFIKPSIKMLRLNHSSGLHFLMKGPCHMKPC